MFKVTSLWLSVILSPGDLKSRGYWASDSALAIVDNNGKFHTGQYINRIRKLQNFDVKSFTRQLRRSDLISFVIGNFGEEW